MASRKNPFRGFKDSVAGAVGFEAFTVGGADIEPTVVAAGIEVDADCTLVLVCERDGESITDNAGSTYTFGTAAGVARDLKAGRQYPYRVRKIVSAGSTNGASGVFLL